MFLKVNFLIIIFQKKIIFKQNKEFLSIKKYNNKKIYKNLF
jgi:hypothetical protein